MIVRTLCLFFLFAAVSALAEPIESPQAVFKDLGYKVDPTWPRLPDGWNLKETGSVAVDSRNHVFIFHRGEHPILEFDPRGKYVRSLGEGVFLRPHGLRFDSEGNMWAVDDGAHIVLKMDRNGRVKMVLGRFGRNGESDLLMNRPTDVAFGPNGDIYISDGYNNSRVVKYSKDGQYIKAWGKKGKGEGEFDLPHTIAVDRQGLVYVGDRQNYRIQIFDPDGKFLKQWTHLGSPWGLFLAKDNTLYMSDGWNNRVLKLNLNGEVLGGIATGTGSRPGQFRFAHHLSVSETGDVYVAEILNWRAQRFFKMQAPPSR
jgi:sugar lactone lactonase YvrE